MKLYAERCVNTVYAGFVAQRGSVNKIMCFAFLCILCIFTIYAIQRSISDSEARHAFKSLNSLQGYKESVEFDFYRNRSGCLTCQHKGDDITMEEAPCITEKLDCKNHSIYFV